MMVDTVKKTTAEFEAHKIWITSGMDVILKRKAHSSYFCNIPSRYM